MRHQHMGLLKVSEAALHRSVSEFLTLSLQPEVFWTTFPSGGGGKIRGAQLKGHGLKAGVPDIPLVYFGRAFWLELKTSNGRVSQDQIFTHASLIAAHSPVAVCRSIDGVAEALRRWDIPLRARISA